MTGTGLSPTSMAACRAMSKGACVRIARDVDTALRPVYPRARHGVPDPCDFLCRRLHAGRAEVRPCHWPDDWSSGLHSVLRGPGWRGHRSWCWPASIRPRLTSMCWALWACCCWGNFSKAISFAQAGRPFDRASSGVDDVGACWPFRTVFGMLGLAAGRAARRHDWRFRAPRPGALSHV